MRPSLIAALAAVVLCLAFASAADAGASPAVKVIATGLNQPKKLTITSSGDIVVALSGDGKAPSTCTDGSQSSCLDHSGAIDEITPTGRVSTLLSGLASVSSGVTDPQATGPVEARLTGGRLRVLFQDLGISVATGVTSFGADTLFGDLVDFAGGAKATEARLGPFEAEHEPDGAAGTAVKYGWESAVNSDPYSFVPYRGGEAIADAGANDVLFASRTGRISVLGVLPTIRERAPVRTFGSKQTKAIEAEAQAVPTAVAVGPDGALYVGELGGAPSDRGTSDVYRIVPGHAPTVYASGFTAIGDLAFDRHGRLLVVELDAKGLNDPGIDTGKPASGEIISVSRSGAKHTLVSRGLDFPTGIAVGSDGYVYVSDRALSSATSGGGGEILRLKLG